jgi:thiol-disulfide isomerase/thioredoxin
MRLRGSRGAAALATLGIAALLAGCGSHERPGGTSGSGPGTATTPGAATKPDSASGPHADPYAALTAQDPQGRALNFADFAGKVRLIDVWASWCGPCRMSIPEMNTLYERYHDRGLVVVGVSVDDNPAAVLEFQRQVPVRYPTVMFNPGLARLIGEPSSIPTTFLVDRTGRLRGRFIGYVEASRLEAEIRRFL